MTRTLYPIYAGEKPCLACAGQGVHYSDNGPAPYEFECEECEGAGKVDKEEDDD